MHEEECRCSFLREKATQDLAPLDPGLARRHRVRIDYLTQNGKKAGKVRIVRCK